jgi:peptidoglycan/xylan/chitin deacetylase (PgdA/CDA1 family)
MKKRKYSKKKSAHIHRMRHISAFLLIFILLFIAAVSVVLSTSYFPQVQQNMKLFSAHEQPFPLTTARLTHASDEGTIGLEKEDEEKSGPPNSNVILHGPRDKKKIALTFDAEMTNGMREAYLSKKVASSYDKHIIDTLNKTETKATLFLTGMWIELYPDVTKELAANHLIELGSHSYADTSYNGECYGLHVLPNASVKSMNISITEELLTNYTGYKNNLFRFPGGCYGHDDVKLVNDAGDTVVHWDVLGNDGFTNNTKQIVHNVVDHVQNGSIIILHMNGAPTAPKTGEALPEIIAILKERGYAFVTVNDLLGLSHP